MGKRGFTLVEVLAVFIILAIISILIVPVISNILNQSRVTVYDTQIKKILNSVYDYTLNNTEFLPEDDETKYVTLAQMKKNGFIDGNIINPNTGNLFPDNLVISIKNVGAGYINKFSDSMLKGFYLFKIETFETITETQPIISFMGYEETPSLFTMNVGDEYIPLTYTAKSSTGTDLTDKVIECITHDSNLIDEIDTTKAGIYYINYSVIDENGYSTLETISVIITDKEAPLLTIAENLTIKSTVNSYDLMDGASCTDNSGKCEIVIDGDVKFGITGKYIVEYKALDPSGNTTTLKRVITVE